MKRIVLLYVFCLVAGFKILAQTNAEKISNFDATRIIIGQSSEIAASGDLILNIQHHFGPVNSGFENFFGFDQAATRIGMDYAFNNWLSVGFGRTTLEKTWDLSLKAKIISQSENGFPINITYFANIGINSLKNYDTLSDKFADRFSFVHQILISHRFGDKISIQLSPTFIHRNLVDLKTDDNDVFALGTSISYSLSRKINLNFEYYTLLSKNTAEKFDNSFSVGVDFITSGHVFQLFFTNSQGLLEQHFIPKTSGKWSNGYFRLGFNIVRVFSLKPDYSFE